MSEYWASAPIEQSGHDPSSIAAARAAQLLRAAPGSSLSDDIVIQASPATTSDSLTPAA